MADENIDKDLTAAQSRAFKDRFDPSGTGTVPLSRMFRAILIAEARVAYWKVATAKTETELHLERVRQELRYAEDALTNARTEAVRLRGEVGVEEAKVAEAHLAITALGGTVDP